MKLDKFAVLGDPWIGGLLEWLFISIWITVWLMVTFGLTDAGDQVIQLFEPMPSPIILLPFNWILWYWTWMIFFFRRADCCRKSERLVEARLANLIYHLSGGPSSMGYLLCKTITLQSLRLALKWSLPFWDCLSESGC